MTQTGEEESVPLLTWLCQKSPVTESFPIQLTLDSGYSGVLSSGTWWMEVLEHAYINTVKLTFISRAYKALEKVPTLSFLDN